ncbi:hypothetical protein SHIRM173S_10185 [Streptomyces hirsutus]
MVAPTWDLMSPTTGRQNPGSLGRPGVDGALGVELRRVLGTDGQVADQDVDLLVLEDLDDVDRLLGALLDGGPVVHAETVEGVAALDRHTGAGDVADLDGVVLESADGVSEVEADLLGVHVESGDELDVADVVIAELDVHQARHLGRRVGVLVVLDALHQ